MLDGLFTLGPEHLQAVHHPKVILTHPACHRPSFPGKVRQCSMWNLPALCRYGTGSCLADLHAGAGLCPVGTVYGIAPPPVFVLHDGLSVRRRLDSRELVPLQDGLERSAVRLH